MPISSPIISRALRDISSCGGGGGGSDSPTCIRGARGRRGGSPFPLPGGVFLGGETAPGCCRRWLCHGGGRGSGRGVRLWDIILWSGTLLRTALAYVEPKGRDKVEAMSSYVTTSHVDLPCHFSSSAFAHASFPPPSFLPPSIHPRHLALIHAGIGTLSSARTLSHVGPRKV